MEYDNVSNRVVDQAIYTSVLTICIRKTLLTFRKDVCAWGWSFVLFNSSGLLLHPLGEMGWTWPYHRLVRLALSFMVLCANLALLSLDWTCLISTSRIPFNVSADLASLSFDETHLIWTSTSFLKQSGMELALSPLSETCILFFLRRN